MNDRHTWVVRFFQGYKQGALQVVKWFKKDLTHNIVAKVAVQPYAKTPTVSNDA